MMKTKLFNIGVFISSLSIGAEIQKISREERDTFHISHTSLEEAIPVGREMERMGVEVIVSRRGTAHLLRENMQIPVLSFPQSSLSVFTSIKSAAEKFVDTPAKKKKIFMPNFRNKINGLNIAEEMLNIEFKQGIYYDSTSLQQIIFNAAQEGFSMVIGGAATMKFARKCGLQFQELITPVSDIIETIENAKSAAQSNRDEKATSYRYQSIMNLASEGIISVDSTGSLTTINEKAKSIFNVGDRDVIGAPVSALITNTIIEKELQKQTPIQDKIVKIENELFVFNQEPLILEEHTVGVVSTFKEIANVIRTENQVRRTLTQGFTAKYVIDDLVYQSSSMSKIVNASKELASTNSTVLIMGETGTGKEVVAQSIHNASQRKQMPFVSVHCAALPEQLLESELFGYEEGAFTGTKRGGKPGLFEMAHQGTIFLDEVDSTSQGVQLRLLRVLQEKEVMRIGADRKIPVNVRVLAAAGKNLWSVVQNGQFRKDLFFRLNVLCVTIPPLRERSEDVTILLKHFVNYHAKKHGIQPVELPESYLRILTSYSWPGNVRQLKHFAEQLVLTSNFQRGTDTLDSLLIDLNNIVDSGEKTMGALPGKAIESLKLADPDFEAENIRKALIEARYSKTKAAKILGISRTTLWRKLKS